MTDSGDYIDLSGASSRLAFDPLELFGSAIGTVGFRILCFFAPLYLGTVSAEYLAGVDLDPDTWLDPWRDLQLSEAVLELLIFPAAWLWLLLLALLRTAWSLLAAPVFGFYFLAVVVFGRFSVFILPAGFATQAALVFLVLSHDATGLGWICMVALGAFVFGATYVFWGIRRLGMPLMREWKGKPAGVDPAFLPWRLYGREEIESRAYLHRGAVVTWIIRSTATGNWELRWHDALGAGGFAGIFPFAGAGARSVADRATGCLEWDQLAAESIPSEIGELGNWISLRRGRQGSWEQVAPGSREFTT